MKGWKEKIQNTFAAAAFAEEGEWTTARDIINEVETKRAVKRTGKRRTSRSRARARAYKA